MGLGTQGTIPDQHRLRLQGAQLVRSSNAIALTLVCRGLDQRTLSRRMRRMCLSRGTHLGPSWAINQNQRRCRPRTTCARMVPTIARCRDKRALRWAMKTKMMIGQKTTARNLQPQRATARPLPRVHCQETRLHQTKSQQTDLPRICRTHLRSLLLPILQPSPTTQRRTNIRMGPHTPTHQTRKT